MMHRAEPSLPTLSRSSAIARLIASLFVALALLVSPLAAPAAAAAMPQMASCGPAVPDGGCPDMDDGVKPCAQTACVSACVSVCLPPAAANTPFYDRAPALAAGPLDRLTGIVPGTMDRPPRTASEM